jgi:hypothetical protein
MLCRNRRQARRKERPLTNTETSNGLHEFPLGVLAVSPSAPEDTAEKREAMKGIFQALAHKLRKYPRLRMLLSECRNFCLRSYIVLTSKNAHRVPMGSVYLVAPTGRVYQNIRAAACIQNTERISSSRPWATPLDWSAYRDSWEAGVEWALSTLASDSTLDSEHKALLISKR